MPFQRRLIRHNHQLPSPSQRWDTTLNTMPSDFLELLNAAVSYGDDTETIDERIRCALFECLFQGMHDNRVASLFRMIGWSNGFDCYAIAGSPAQSAARTRADIERVVSDFAGSCLTAETVLRNYGRSMDDNNDGNAGDDTVVVALIRPLGAASAEVIGNTVDPFFAADHPLALGPQYANVQGAARTISTALFCLKAAPALVAAVQRIPRPLRSMDALPERALIGDESARDELVNMVYRSLAAAGPDDPTLLTVSTLLKHGGSLEATAKELNVHPNTIRYRLKRAAESTGWDATDPREAYVLTCAIALGRIREHATA